ncbi:MAG: ATP phosphoribosyltransferase [Xanthomonadaceae bacterium]|nr:ATP phosphoribosyltransferase [Xanthomonadaceae bacterium]
MADPRRLKVAVQKSGRLTDPSLELMVRCGLRFSRARDNLVCYGENMPIDLLLVRDDDIPQLVADGDCDAGIVGGNVAREFALAHDSEPFRTARTLDFGSCRLCLATPVDSGLDTPASLAGKRVATSYPRLTESFLRGIGIDAEVVLLGGAVEIAPRLGKADAICDLVSTGQTLRANHLKEIFTVDESRACLITSPHPLPDTASTLLERILMRVDGVLAVNGSKYIMLHAPRAKIAEITRLLPGVEAPTVLPLDGCTDRVAIHAVCTESVFWETLEALKGAGASAMLVLPVEKMLA